MTTTGTAIMNTDSTRIIHNPTSNQQAQREKKKIEKQLTWISLIQVLVYMMLNIPNSSYQVYNIVTSATIKSADRAAIESFISAMCVILTYIYGTVSEQFVSITLSLYSIIFLAKFLHLHFGFIDLSSRIPNGINTMCDEDSTSILVDLKLI